VAALLIAGYTLSAKDGTKEDLEGVRAAALRLAQILYEKDTSDEAKKLVAAITTLKGDPAAKHQGLNFKKYVAEDYDLMVMYMTKEKGGDGLHPDIQVSPKLKGTQEYLENLYAYLSGKKLLNEKNFKDAGKELELAGYRTAVSAEVIHAYVPKKKTEKRDPDLWVKTAIAMREGALEFAAAAKKKDAEALQKAANNVLTSCVQCHKMFQ
jgi:hypothetical protein